MNGGLYDLIHSYLDGTIEPAGEVALGEMLAASPENARAFAGVALLHAQLRNTFAADRTVPETVASRAEPAKRSISGRSLMAPVAVVAVAVVLLVWPSGSVPRTAAAELDRLIEAPASPGDRIYRIASRDTVPDGGDDRLPPLDGALLYVRNPDRYVLVRRHPDGRPFTIGSDGERGWSVKPDGAVRVSSNPLRFRGPLPGNQYGIPFVDPRSDLRQLRDAYVVTGLPDADGVRRLAFEKRSQEHRGPRRVEVWYEPATRVVHRMEFEGLPRARGGPNAVSVALIEQRDLGPDFFQHGSHHGPDRKVIQED